MIYKAISLHQPFASAIALGLKTNETRSWPCAHRGPLAIHATKSNQYRRIFNELSADSWFRQAMEEAGLYTWDTLPKGFVVCVCDVIRCDTITPDFNRTISAQENALGDYSIGRFAWQLRNVRPPKGDKFAVRGRQGFFSVELLEEGGEHNERPQKERQEGLQVDLL